MTAPESHRIHPADAISFTTALLVASGATSHNADVVADHLIDSELRGLPSHGLIRVSQYVAEAESGRLDPTVEPVISRTDGTVSVIDGRWGYGAVAAMMASETVAERAGDFGTAFASVQRVQHTGRLGAYTEPLAEKGFLAVAFAAGADRFHRVAPFGARQGRMSTNPISWAIPVAGTRPLVADFSTSVMPEGRIRVLQAAGKPIPPDVIGDYQGNPTQDAAALYGTPPWPAPGFLLPLGGAHAGHKGYALGLMAESFATLMTGDDASSPERGNNLAIFAVRGDPALPERASRMVDYMKSAEPVDPARPVLVPGDPEIAHAARASMLDIAGPTWRALCELAITAQVAIPG